MARLKRLVAAFEHIKRNKASDEAVDYSVYLPHFDEPARAYFWWPTDAEYGAWLAQWYATPLDTRATNPTLKHGWLFEAMINSFRNGEYNLLSCRLVSPSAARLEFHAWAYPYGGTGCMQALIEAFGFAVTEIHDGS